MKHIKHSVTTLMLLLLLTNSQCKKHNEEPQLPPLTTTGAMTFGCKINGKVFVPKDGRGKPGLICQYVNLGTGEGGGWYLNIPATDWKPNPPEGVNIETDSLLVEEGRSYEFKQTKGSPQAFYDKGEVFPAVNNNSGKLKITRFDQTNRIVSGTFFFTGTNAFTGEKVEVTDGRFDIRY